LGISESNSMEKFSFTKMWFEPIFLSGSLAVFNIVANPLKFWGFLVAAFGGEMRSDYFKNRAPVRKSQISLVRLALLGDQIVGNFGRKNQLAVLF